MALTLADLTADDWSLLPKDDPAPGASNVKEAPEPPDEPTVEEAPAPEESPRPDPSNPDR